MYTKSNMTTEEFLDLSVAEIARITEIDEPCWSRYLYGSNYTERTLTRAAEKLQMASDDLYRGISLRRKIYQSRLVEKSNLNTCT